ncbi:unnamed protein product [Cylicocyclus nassatus]|uniref:Uncharacterized protein n=1 Tax=Cylicocyclus nassatus TaxID=53992 RepID=A0AA36GWC1_CYLNA|nr:unnamed protein product [Cylicocyclus nassatus]
MLLFKTIFTAVLIALVQAQANYPFYPSYPAPGWNRPMGPPQQFQQFQPPGRPFRRDHRIQRVMIYPDPNLSMRYAYPGRRFSAPFK